MANYFVSYDLNGQHPTHAEMDKHLGKLGSCTQRVLETVWYVKHDGSTDDLYKYVNSILSNNDGVLVIRASFAKWRNILADGDKLKRCWGGA